MSTVWYWAVIEHHAGEYFVTIPDLAGVTAADPDHSEALRLIAEFAADHVGDLVDGGHAVPPASSDREVGHDPEVREWGRALVPVDVPGTSVKISLSIDAALLKRIDAAAGEAGETRSGFLAGAALHGVRTLHSRQVSDDDLRRAVESIDFSKVDLRSAIEQSMKK